MDQNDPRSVVQLRNFVAGMQTLQGASARFGIRGLAGRVDDDSMEAMKFALIIPLAALGTTSEQFGELAAKAQAMLAATEEIIAA